MNKLLVPVDFSEHSLNASRYALELAVNAGAKLNLFNVVFDPVIESEEDPGEFNNDKVLPPEVIKKFERRTHHDLRELVVELWEAGDQQKEVEISTSVKRGVPEREILDTANALMPDLLVMGTKGKDLSENYLGSITANIVKFSPAPVLTVPFGANFHSVRNVLFGTGFDPGDSRHIRFLMKFLEKFQSRIHCLHVHPGTGKTNREEEQMRSLEKDFEQELKEGRIRFEIRKDENVVSGLEEYIKENNIDWLVSNYRERSFISRLFHPSKIKKMLFHSSLPLLIFSKGND